MHDHPRYFRWVFFALLLLVCLPTEASARRTVVDDNSLEVTGDANDGEVVSLPFAVDFGSGLFSEVTVSLTPCCPGGGADNFNVALYFSPTDYIYATLLAPDFDYFPPPEPAVRLRNEHETSAPLDPVDEASIFEFIVTHSLTFAPFCDPGDFCGTYTDYIGSALIEFTDLSSSGMSGDFGLSLSCTELCRDIGFHLGGQDFSFNGQPGVSLALYEQEFRNTQSVPEPTSWSMLLLGFAATGIAMRARRRKAASEAPRLT